DDLKKKIRHTYDLHQLLKQDEYLKFLQSKAFDEMLVKVCHDDVVSFRNNNNWLNNHPNDALIFKNLENVWSDLKTIYSSDFKNLVFGELPEDEAVLETLKMIRERMNTIQWTIQTEP
ncbi:MAG: nucleotidyl transferase AbiEii/AbiGii toxin family protein, partial [Bacteroidetes bacterium]|nr:nucleotidyl transferase AbiEii/AbiGii toxin family protein [Bacteroidota bacterium]